MKDGLDYYVANPQGERLSKAFKTADAVYDEIKRHKSALLIVDRHSDFKHRGGTHEKASDTPEAPQFTGTSDEIMEQIAAWDETPEGKAFRKANDIRKPAQPSSECRLSEAVSGKCSKGTRHCIADHEQPTSEAKHSPLPKEALQVVTALEQIQQDSYSDFTIDTCEDAISLIVRAYPHAERLADALRDMMHAYGCGMMASKQVADKARAALAAYEKEQQ